MLIISVFCASNDAVNASVVFFSASFANVVLLEAPVSDSCWASFDIKAAEFNSALSVLSFIAAVDFCISLLLLPKPSKASFILFPQRPNKDVLFNNTAFIVSASFVKLSIPNFFPIAPLNSLNNEPAFFNNWNPFDNAINGITVWVIGFGILFSTSIKLVNKSTTPLTISESANLVANCCQALVNLVKLASNPWL